MTHKAREDYQFVRRVLRHLDNKHIHKPALKKLIELFAKKRKGEFENIYMTNLYFNLDHL